MRRNGCTQTPSGNAFAWMLLYTVIMTTTAVVGACMGYKYREVPVVKDSDAHVLKTVAHIDLSDRDDLELISRDYDNDIAYYKYVQPDRDVSVGDTVYTFDGVGATLTSVDAVGFTFETESLVAGASGTAILNADGVQIGYVSRRLENGKYYAIWS